MNTDDIKTANDFFTWDATLGEYKDWAPGVRLLRKKLMLALPEAEKLKVKLNRRQPFFADDKLVRNDDGTVKEHVELSPSGRYKLAIHHYGTGKNTWNYTRGLVTRVSDGKQVADVQRNYSTFWFTWLEDHVSGHDFMMCGEDYQGSTFCELDTGRMLTQIEDAAFSGGGWCQVKGNLMPDGVTLVARGCFWGGPYEYRFYDVSDPIEKGWAKLPLPDNVDLDDRDHSSVTHEDGCFVWQCGERIFKADGTRESEIEQMQSKINEQAGRSNAINTVFAETIAKYPDEDEDDHLWEVVLDHKIHLRRDGDAIVKVSEWKSEYKLAQDAASTAYWADWHEKKRKWQAEEPMYLVLAECMGSALIKANTGFGNQLRSERQKGDYNDAYFGVSASKYDPNVERKHSASIVWGTDNGRITLELWVYGKGNLNDIPDFDRTPEGMHQAWAAAQAHLAADPCLQVQP